MTAGLIVQPMSQWLMRSREFTTSVDGISSFAVGSYNDVPVGPVSNVDDPWTYANSSDGDWPEEGNQSGLNVSNDFSQGISFADPYYTYFQAVQGNGTLWRSDRWMHEGPIGLSLRMADFNRATNLYLPRLLLVFPEHGIAVSSLEQTRSSPYDTGTYYMGTFDLANGARIGTIAELRYDIPLGTSRRRVMAWCSNRVDGVVYSVEIEQTFQEIGFVPTVVAEKWYVMATTLGGNRTTLEQFDALPYPPVQRIPYGISYDYIGERILLCVRSWPNRAALTSTNSPATDSIEAMDKETGTMTPLVTWTPPVEEVSAGVFLHAQLPAVAWTHGLENVMYLWRTAEPSLPLGTNDNLRRFTLDGGDEQIVVDSNWHSNMFGRAEISNSGAGRHTYNFGPGMRAQWEL